MELIELYRERNKLALEGKPTSGLTEQIEEMVKVKPHKPIVLTKSYYEHPENYPKYDNYDAIDVPRVELIPYDYDGIMGVPITFLSARDRIFSMPKCNKFQKNCILICTQFQIIKFRKGNDDKDLSVNGKTPYFRILIKKLS